MNREPLLSLCLIIVFIAVLFCTPNFINAKDIDKVRDALCIPDTGIVQILELDDGSILIGRTVSIRENTIDFVTKLGLLEIAISNIKRIRETPAESIVKGKYWFPNPNQTRLFFAPTGRMLKAGEGYFSDYYLLFPGFAIGLTNNITLGGGMSIFPGLSLSDQIFYITPKIGLKAAENVNFATGALIINIPQEDDSDISTLGIVYGVGTFGSSNTSLTVGLGYGFAGSELADSPMVMLGGEARLSRRISLVSENWIVPGANAPLLSFGTRFMGESLSVDLALVGAFEDGDFFSIPYLDFVFSF